jgi:acyl transferase domain-containing protein
MPVQVATRVEPFDAHGGRWIAGVSSFGFSGTNAHIVVEAAPDAEADTSIGNAPPRPVQVLMLSAKGDAALNDSVRRLREHLEGAGSALTLADVCHSASAGRAHFAHRLAVTAKTRDELIQSLRSIEK